MALFGKKTEEEQYEDEDELIEEGREERKLTRKFKDLKPENKKKRKEPPKPWGKNERLLILIVVLLTILISWTLMFISKKPEPFSFPHFNINFGQINFSSLNPFRERTIIIEKND